MFTRAQGGCVIHRCQNKTPDRKMDQEVWMTSCIGSEHEQSVSRVFAFEEESWLSELAEALRRVLHVVRGRWKSQHKKIVHLSPYFEKPFYSKVIKSFVPELRSRKCFCVSRFLCYLYIWVMNILCTFHIFMYGYVTITILETNYIWGKKWIKLNRFICLHWNI